LFHHVRSPVVKSIRQTKAVRPSQIVVIKLVATSTARSPCVAFSPFLGKTDGTGEKALDRTSATASLRGQ